MPSDFQYLLIDISNSVTKLAPCSLDCLQDDPISIPTDQIDAESLQGLPWKFVEDELQVVLSSVVPSQDKVVENVFGIDRVFKISSSVRLGVEIDYPEPETIGSDRLANAAAAYSLHGAPVVVVDFGTTVTFDIVSSVGAYVGGVIAPGLASMTDYMFDRTALLPKIDLDEPSSAIGKSTEEAMLSGAVIGYRGLVKEILAAIADDLGNSSLPVIATGGYAQLISSGLSEISIINERLTLEGLRIVAGLNVP